MGTDNVYQFFYYSESFKNIHLYFFIESQKQKEVWLILNYILFIYSIFSRFSFTSRKNNDFNSLQCKETDLAVVKILLHFVFQEDEDRKKREAEQATFDLNDIALPHSGNNLINDAIS